MNYKTRHCRVTCIVSAMIILVVKERKKEKKKKNLWKEIDQIKIC